MKNNQSLRSINRIKLQYKFERTWKLFNADQLATALCISKAQAYRIIKNPELLTKQHKTILNLTIQLEWHRPVIVRETLSPY